MKKLKRRKAVDISMYDFRRYKSDICGRVSFGGLYITQGSRSVDQISFCLNYNCNSYDELYLKRSKLVYYDIPTLCSNTTKKLQGVSETVILKLASLSLMRCRSRIP
ncbi:hypothetical protein OSB04_013258 [Centaurea solstitialis]|uniref:Uncharacterized protein n=1 Tax=Centaurea solstitialis TaxID=347529 RepID=A0AA38TCX5_9ASTR|nr:hypothetical protein OSB04_013258 [Centaurea solstitialis]